MLDTVAKKMRAREPDQAVWPRIGGLLVIVGIGFALMVTHAIDGATAGSYTAYLLVAPILGALIASGIRPSPGVGDAEFDWMVAILLCAAGLLSLRMLSARLPALSGLWNWHHFTPVIWVMTVGTVLFSARHVLRLWRAWGFALLCAPAMPFLLVTAKLGGTEDDAVMVAAAVGSLAVYLATSTFGLAHRFLAAAVTMAVAVGLDHLVGFEHLLPRTLLVAGAVPVLSVAAVRYAAHVRVAASMAAHPAKGNAKFPHVGGKGLSALIVLAAAMQVSAPPAGSEPARVTADRGWINALNLRPTAEFDFIRRFLGPEATLTRYALDGEPAVAIDVISTPNLARLNDYKDAVWYPSATPVSYRPGGIVGPVEVRTAQSDPDSATSSVAYQWYALTWLWQTGQDYQRVTVVVNQDLRSDTTPAPEPITWTNSLLEPVLWLSRQQPVPTGVAPKRVSRTAALVAERILAAGQPA